MALTLIHILSSSLTLALVQIVSSQTKGQTQQVTAKGGWYWNDGVSVATVLVFAKCVGHVYHRYFKLYTIIDITYG